MKLPVLKGILFAALFASGITLATSPPAPVQLVAGALLAYLLPGFVFLTFLGERDRPGLDDLFLSITISPIVLTLLVLAFHAAGSSLDGATRASSLTLLALLALCLLRERRVGAGVTQVPSHGIALTCVLFSGSILILFLANRFLLIRSDAWYHGSVVSEIIDRGIPPKETFLPDYPIRYMWLYHLFIVSTRTLTGLDVFPALALFNVMTALAFPYLVFRFTRVFSSRRRDLIATPIFAISGLASAAWILWPLMLARALTGEHRGWSEVMRLLGEIDLNSMNVVFFLSPLDKLYPVGNWMVNVLHKFIIITAFSFSLNIMLLVFVIAASVGFERRFALRPFLTVFFLALGALLFHVVGGMILVGSVIGSGLLFVLGRLIRRRRDLPVFHAFLLPGAGILAWIAASPYLRSLTAGNSTLNSPGSLFHIGMWNIVTIALPLVILFRPARRVLRGIFSCTTEPYALLATWIVTLAAGNVFINLVTVNESKFVYFLFYILFPPIVWQILDGIEAARGRRRMLLVAWTALLFLVPPVLTYRGFMLDKPDTRIEEKRYHVTADDHLIYAWIARQTPSNSVVIESFPNVLMPVYAHRHDFCPDRGTIMTFGYSDDTTSRYESIQDKFLSGTELTPEDVQVLVDLKLPLYVVLWQEDIERTPRVRAALDDRPEWFTLVYENAGGRVYSLRGT